MRKRLLIVAGAVGIGIAGASATAIAQDAAPSRAEVLAEVKAAQTEAQEALRVFLDRQRPRAERIAAGRQIAGMAAEQDADRLIAVLRDRGEDEAVRTLALEALSGQDRAEVVDAAIAIVTDPANGGEVLKEAAVDQLQALVQFTQAGRSKAPEILSALRTAAGSPSPTVRNKAMAFLALKNDPAAVEVLKDSLERLEGAPFSKAQAIAFLSANSPRQHFAAIRPHLKDPDPNTRVAAVKALGADPASRPEIVRMLQASQERRVRTAALQSLSAHDPDFPDYALGIARNAGEEPQIRALAVLELNKHLNRNQASPEDEEEIEQTLRTLLMDRERQPLAVRTAALESLSVHDEEFPQYILQIAQDPREAQEIRLRALDAIRRDAEKLESELRRQPPNPGGGGR